MTAPVQDQTRPLTPAQLATLLVLVQAQADFRQRITDAAIAAAVAAFKGFTGWWTPGATGQAVRQILRTVQPAQKQAARVTDAYLSRVLTQMTGTRAPTVGVIDVTKLRRQMHAELVDELVAGRVVPMTVYLGSTHDGPAPTINDPFIRTVGDEEFADPGAAYGRAADSYRYDVLARGMPEEQAHAKALTRAATIARTDIALAIREQWRAGLINRSMVTGFRRILHPELGNGGPPCGLCVVAADRVYRKEELMAIHNNCRCEPLPIVRGYGDPGLRLNEDDLERLYAAAGAAEARFRGREPTGDERSTYAKFLLRTNVAIAEHGELGPVLVDADQAHRGPAQAAATKSRDPAVTLRAQLDSYEQTLPVLESRKANGENVDAPIRFQTNRIAELRRLLAA